MKFSDILSQVIELAKKANAARAHRAHATGGFPVVTSGIQVKGGQAQGSSGPPVMLQPVPEEIALHDFLEAQSPETVYMLTAVMYLGRGDYDLGRLLDNYGLMSKRFGDPKWAARQMADKLSLWQYLEEGRRKVIQAGMDLDAMVSTAAA